MKGHITTSLNIITIINMLLWRCGRRAGVNSAFPLPVILTFDTNGCPPVADIRSIWRPVEKNIPPHSLLHASTMSLFVYFSACGHCCFLKILQEGLFQISNELQLQHNRFYESRRPDYLQLIVIMCLWSRSMFSCW